MPKRTNIEISEMMISDLEIIKEKLESEFDNFWNYNILKREIESDISKIYVLKLGDEIAGFAAVSIVLDEAEITNIVVKKTYRGKKLSLFLMATLINSAINSNCKKIHLEVNKNNEIARNLYKNLGFNQVGLRKNYYKNQDAILMTKILRNVK